MDEKGHTVMAGMYKQVKAASMVREELKVESRESRNGRVRVEGRCTWVKSWVGDDGERLKDWGCRWRRDETGPLSIQ